MKPVTCVALILASLTVTIACGQPPSSQSAQSADQSAIATDARATTARPGEPTQSPAVSINPGEQPGTGTGTKSGTTEATTAPTASPDPGTVEAPSEPTSPQAILADLSDRRQALGICADGFDAGISPSGSMVYPVGNHQYLVQMLCFMASYQGSYEYLIYDKSTSETQVKALKLARFQEDENGQIASLEEQQVGGLPEYDPGRQQLTLYTKFTGAGTCGSLATYQLQGGQFQLVEYRAKFNCDETFVDPSQYPQVFP